MVSPVLLGLVCLLLAMPGTPAVAAAQPAPVTGPGARTAADDARLTTLSAATFERRLFNRVNARRDARGCRLLRLNSALVRAARSHSSLMASRREFSHRVAGESSFATRITRAGYTRWRIIAENLAYGQATPRAVVRAWVRSRGHRANLDNCRLRDVGYAVVMSGGRPWITADFGRRR